MASSKCSFKKSKASLIVPYTSFIFSLLFIFLGVLVVLAASFKNGFDWQTIFKEDRPPESQVADSQQTQKPVKLYIPKLSKILDISEGRVVDNRWEISSTGVSYLNSSAIPGKVGNSILYGHNRLEILGGLKRLSQGDAIFVVTANGDFTKFKVFETKEISPTEVDILNQSTDSRLTIYTCSGFLDQARFVVVANFSS